MEGARLTLVVGLIAVGGLVQSHAALAIEVRQRGRLRDVRLVGIDTPEVFFGAECGGAEASDSIKRMLERRRLRELIEGKVWALTGTSPTRTAPSA